MTLQATRLSKRYNDKWVLRDVSFEAERGRILGLFGVSGAGKTTALRIIAGRERPNGGTVVVDAKDVTDLSSEARNFHFSTPPPSSIFDKLLRSDITANLSSGERAAKLTDDVLATASNVLLLDDLFCSMDYFAKHDLFVKLRKCAKDRDLAVVFATSNYEDIFEFCDTVAILDGGEIRQTGTPQETYTKPLSHAVASVTGRHNLFEARRLTSSKSDNPQFQTITGEHRLGVEKVGLSSLGALNQNVYLGIRPEHISIAFGASFPEDNLLKAAITGIQLLGSTTLVELNANGLILNALVLRLVGLNIGDECMLGLPPDRIQVLKN